jgi:hypothetical protein
MTIQDICKALRTVNRPDAAQRLENRTEEQWDACERLAVDDDDDDDYVANRNELAFYANPMDALQYCFNWSWSKEGEEYWGGVWESLREAARIPSGMNPEGTQT